MPTSILEQYRIADILEWHDTKQLVLNPVFQRRQVWTKAAKVYLIDTILRRLPIPKVFMRMQVDLNTKKSYREVVDGQQRLRAIIEFAKDRLVLTKRAGEFADLTYSTLSDEVKELFLSYPIGVDQLINASDSDVLEVFARLNAYTIPLNPPELRHAAFQGEFKWAIHNCAKRWEVLWEDLEVVTTRQRVRMRDDSLMAEMFLVLLEGLIDGGEARITRYYKAYDPRFSEDDPVITQVDQVLGFIVDEFEDLLKTTSLSSAPHFLMLFAAVAHALVGLPPGELGTELPARCASTLSDLNKARENLSVLAGVLDADGPEGVPKELASFMQASSASLHRISSRRVRFAWFYQALEPTDILEDGSR